jgi:hypothetical protein
MLLLLLLPLVACFVNFPTDYHGSNTELNCIVSYVKPRGRDRNKQELNSSVTSCNKAKRGERIY